MPWTPRDARRHVRGLTPRQARRWSSVANDVLRRCLADGGAQATCEGSAIRQANAVAQRHDHAAQATNQRHIVINTVVTVPPTRMTLNNQEYLTAPCVMVVEGVLNDSLILAEELHPHQWDGMPVVLGHPLNEAGLPHSARQPSVVAVCGMGHIYHARLGAGTRQGHPVASLAGELWIHLAQAAACGPEGLQAVNMLESQTPLNVSTAFYSDAESRQGSFYGTPYREIHRNIQPDHLALLPNDIGACSIADGCGAPRLNHATLTYTSITPHDCACPGPVCTCPEETLPMTDPITGWRRFVQVLRDFVHQEEQHGPDPPDEEDDPVPVTVPPDEDEDDEDEESPEDDGSPLHTEVSDVQIREAVYGALAREMGQDVTPIFLDSVDTEAQTFTFRQGERLRRRRWRMDNQVLMLEPESATEDVQRVIDYIPVPATNGTMHDKETVPMPTNVKRWVDLLITNTQTTWTEDDRPTLETFPEAALLRMAQDAARMPQPTAPREGYLSVNEALDNVEPEEREAVTAAIQTYKRHKDKLIELLMANTQNPFPREQLQAMNAEDLTKLVRMAGDIVPGETPERGANYSGRRMPHIRVVTEEEDVPAPPKTMELVVQRQKELGLRV